jgi:hypothetical protein
LVERVRRKLDVEEKGVILHMLEEGVERGDFEVESLPLMADIISYSIKGLEVPYIYDRIGEGLGDMESQKIVTNILSRVLLKGGKK